MTRAAVTASSPLVDGRIVFASAIAQDDLLGEERRVEPLTLGVPAEPFIGHAPLRERPVPAATPSPRHSSPCALPRAARASEDSCRC